jgi:hypothetical protein
VYQYQHDLIHLLPYKELLLLVQHVTPDKISCLFSLKFLKYSEKLPCYYFFSIVPPAHSGPRPLIQFRNYFLQTVGLLGWLISPSQDRYLNTGQHKHRINAHTGIHALSWVRTHDPSVRASEESSWLSPCGYCDRLRYYITRSYLILSVYFSSYIAISSSRIQCHRKSLGTA